MILAKLMCIATIIVNDSSLEWNKHDSKMLKYSKNVCATRKRYEDTPCLKKFIKKGKKNYWAICGAKSRTNNFFIRYAPHRRK